MPCAVRLLRGCIVRTCRWASTWASPNGAPRNAAVVCTYNVGGRLDQGYCEYVDASGRVYDSWSVQPSRMPSENGTVPDSVFFFSCSRAQNVHTHTCFFFFFRAHVLNTCTHVHTHTCGRLVTHAGTTTPHPTLGTWCPTCLPRSPLRPRRPLGAMPPP